MGHAALHDTLGGYSIMSDPFQFQSTDFRVHFGLRKRVQDSTTYLGDSDMTPHDILGGKRQIYGIYERPGAGKTA